MPIKWKPMIMSLPYVIVVVLAKLLLRKFGQPGFLEFSDLSIIYTGGVFLLGFNLAGDALRDVLDPRLRGRGGRAGF